MMGGGFSIIKLGCRKHALPSRSLPPRHAAQQLHEERQLVLVPAQGVGTFGVGPIGSVVCLLFIASCSLQ